MATQGAWVSGSVGKSASPNHPVLASWTDAVEIFKTRLTKDEKKIIKLEECQRATFKEFFQQAKDARDEVERGRHPFTATIQNALDLINRYAVAGDQIIQHHTEYASLAWGSLRFLFLVGLRSIRTV